MERMLDLPWQNAQWTDVCICKDAPADMVVALGSHYQRLFIIPSLKAVIVRQGSGGNFSDAQFLRLVLGRSNENAGLTCSLVWQTIRASWEIIRRMSRRS